MGVNDSEARKDSITSSLCSSHLDLELLQRMFVKNEPDVTIDSYEVWMLGGMVNQNGAGRKAVSFTIRELFARGKEVTISFQCIHMILLEVLSFKCN